MPAAIAPPTIVGLGSTQSGTTTVNSGNATLAASLLPGDLLLYVVVNKYPNNGPTTPAGWTLLAQDSGGHGAAGLNTGNVYVTVYGKISSGTNEPTFVTTVSSGNASGARMIALRPPNGYVFELPTASSGPQNTPGTNWSVLATTGIEVVENDIVVVFSGTNTAARTYSAEALTLTGVVFASETEQADVSPTVGDRLAIVISTHLAASGRGGTAMTFAMTASGSATDAPAGATVFVVCHPSFASSSSRGPGPSRRQMDVFLRRARGVSLRRRSAKSTEEELEELHRGGSAQ